MYCLSQISIKRSRCIKITVTRLSYELGLHGEKNSMEIGTLL